MDHRNTLRHQLARTPLFAGLPDVELDALAAAASEKRYARDEIVFFKGDRPTGMFVVLAGMVKVICQSPKGCEKVIDLVTPGQVFGEAALLQGIPYPYMAVALSSTQAMLIDARTVLDLATGSAAFSRRLLEQLSRRVLLSMRDIVDFRVRSPLERLVGYLYDRSAETQQVCPVVVMQAPKHVIASRLGMTPESFSRCLRELADSALIEVAPGHVKVLDRARLARFRAGA